MRKQISVEIKGMDRLKRMMARAPSVISKRLDTAIKKSIYQIQRNVIPITPVDTGMLRRSITLGTSFGHLQGRIRPTVNYAFYVHEGTRYMAGRPYLRQGLDQSMDEINNIFNKEIVEATKDITR